MRVSPSRFLQQKESSCRQNRRRGEEERSSRMIPIGQSCYYYSINQNIDSNKLSCLPIFSQGEGVRLIGLVVLILIFIQMSFDFFNEGLKKESEIEFSKEQNAFLQSKLRVLDPNSTKSILIGIALQFLKYSEDTSQLQDLKQADLQVAGTKAISYADMKKIFRGVALHQADIEPSTINIEANIKTKLPIFYDDQSDQEQPSNQPPPKPQPTQASPPPQTQPKPPQENNLFRQQKPVNDKPGVFSFDAPVRPPQSNPIEQTVSPTFLPQQSQAKEKQKQTALNIKVREFEARWQKLKTSGNKIEGGEVKNLFKNTGQRSNLSRAWKLCCLTHSGSLTKGQFYVFLELITSSHIPEALTPEMKQSMTMLDQPKHTRSKQNLQPSHRASSIQNPSMNKLASSQLFQNFGKADSNVEVRGRVKTQQKIELMPPPDKLITARSQLQQMARVTNNHNEDLTVIRRGQESMNNLLGEIEQFMTAVKGRNNDVKEQLDELKHNQQMLNQRLNKVCVAMNGIIVHQNSLIEQLVNDFTTQSNLNQQRVAFLENHVLQLTEQLQQKTIAIKTMTKKVEQLNRGQAHPQPQPQAQLQPQSQTRIAQARPQPYPQTRQTHAPQQPQTVEEIHPAVEQTQPHHPEHYEETKAKVQQQQKKREQMQYEQRMKMKRAQVIQLIMHLTPLSPEEEPALIQRISEYSEEQLNTVYYNCYQKLKARQLAQQQQAERLQRAQESKVNHQSQDDFSSSNFGGHSAPIQQDMFG